MGTKERKEWLTRVVQKDSLDGSRALDESIYDMKD
jgi:hypothetical protein